MPVHMDDQDDGDQQPDLDGGNLLLCVLQFDPQLHCQAGCVALGQLQ